jgi:hypothetical protein
MAPCWRCTTPIHPVHGNEDRECQACFRDRERRALPALKKRNLKRMLERQAEDDAAAKRLLDELDRLRASPPPNPPWLQRLVATVCGVHLSRWLPSVFGDHAAKLDAWANAQRTDSGPEQDDSNVAGRLQVGDFLLSVSLRWWLSYDSLLCTGPRSRSLALSKLSARRSSRAGRRRGSSLRSGPPSSPKSPKPRSPSATAPTA